MKVAYLQISGRLNATVCVPLRNDDDERRLVEREKLFIAFAETHYDHFPGDGWEKAFDRARQAIVEYEGPTADIVAAMMQAWNKGRH